MNFQFFNWLSTTGCSLNIVLFSKNSQTFATSPSPVTVHSYCVESYEGLSQRCRRTRAFAVNCEKNTIFLEHPVYNKEWGAIYSVTWICICLPVLHIDCWKVSLQPTSSHQPLSTGLSVGRFDIWSVVFFSLKGGGKLHFHAPIGALV